MIRRIIKIDADKCDGCGACTNACHEGAIELINGKAVLTKENYCDGLGDCLPNCHTGAITFEEREAPEYDEKAVQLSKISKLKRSVKNWPVQIKLAPITAPYFDDADILIAADCTAYACEKFHEKYTEGKIILVGCPKLDAVDYAEKLGEIFAANNVKSINLLRMNVPCCGGMTVAIEKAIKATKKEIPFNVTIIDTQGNEI